MRNLILICFAVITIVACSSTSQSNEGVIITPLELAAGTSLNGLPNTNKQVHIISDQTSLDRVAANYPLENPLQVDFDTAKVILVDMGLRNTGGYSIRVESATEHDNHVLVNVLLQAPGETCITTQVISNPFQFVSILTQKEVLVAEELAAMDCA